MVSSCLLVFYVCFIYPVLSKAELIQIVNKKERTLMKLFFIFCKIFYFIVCLNSLESIFFLMMLGATSILKLPRERSNGLWMSG